MQIPNLSQSCTNGQDTCANSQDIFFFSPTQACYCPSLVGLNLSFCFQGPVFLPEDGYGNGQADT